MLAAMSYTTGSRMVCTQRFRQNVFLFTLILLIFALNCFACRGPIKSDLAFENTQHPTYLEKVASDTVGNSVSAHDSGASLRARSQTWRLRPFKVVFLPLVSGLSLLAIVFVIQQCYSLVGCRRGASSSHGIPRLLSGNKGYHCRDVEEERRSGGGSKDAPSVDLDIRDSAVAGIHESKVYYHRGLWSAFVPERMGPGKCLKKIRVCLDRMNGFLAAMANRKIYLRDYNGGLESAFLLSLALQEEVYYLSCVVRRARARREIFLVFARSGVMLLKHMKPDFPVATTRTNEKQRALNDAIAGAKTLTSEALKAKRAKQPLPSIQGSALPAAAISILNLSEATFLLYLCNGDPDRLPRRIKEFRGLTYQHYSLRHKQLQSQFQYTATPFPFSDPAIPLPHHLTGLQPLSFDSTETQIEAMINDQMTLFNSFTASLESVGPDTARSAPTPPIPAGHGNLEKDQAEAEQGFEGSEHARLPQSVTSPTHQNEIQSHHLLNSRGESVLDKHRGPSGEHQAQSPLLEKIMQSGHVNFPGSRSRLPYPPKRESRPQQGQAASTQPVHKYPFELPLLQSSDYYLTYSSYAVPRFPPVRTPDIPHLHLQPSRVPPVHIPARVHSQSALRSKYRHKEVKRLPSQVSSNSYTQLQRHLHHDNPPYNLGHLFSTHNGSEHESLSPQAGGQPTMDSPTQQVPGWGHSGTAAVPHGTPLPEQEPLHPQLLQAMQRLALHTSSEDPERDRDKDGDDPIYP